jgi:hypothetical protein
LVSRLNLCSPYWVINGQIKKMATFISVKKNQVRKFNQTFHQSDFITFLLYLQWTKLQRIWNYKPKITILSECLLYHARNTNLNILLKGICKMNIRMQKHHYPQLKDAHLPQGRLQHAKKMHDLLRNRLSHD